MRFNMLDPFNLPRYGQWKHNSSRKQIETRKGRHHPLNLGMMVAFLFLLKSPLHHYLLELPDVRCKINTQLSQLFSTDLVYPFWWEPQLTTVTISKLRRARIVFTWSVSELSTERLHWPAIIPWSMSQSQNVVLAMERSNSSVLTNSPKVTVFLSLVNNT